MMSQPVRLSLASLTTLMRTGALAAGEQPHQRQLLGHVHVKARQLAQTPCERCDFFLSVYLSLFSSRTPHNFPRQ